LIDWLVDWLITAAIDGDELSDLQLEHSTKNWEVSREASVKRKISGPTGYRNTIRPALGVIILTALFRLQV